ncbi:Hypothetical predicted protein [Cloeon dipterum]|uniref:C2H2-type domain-containing protein n=2 Tax=Cloeon dipterum TaxID=197152 RepID=A0A8S1C279_9INSE|nr:Hypothetical predicted protein [Cloeon dipterum]
MHACKSARWNRPRRICCRTSNRFDRPDCTSGAAPMDYYHQQQPHQAPPQPVPAPSYPLTNPQNTYNQYGPSTSTENYIQYPTSHIFQQHTTTEVTTTSLGYSADPVTKAVMDNILGKLPTKKNQLVYRCEVCNMDFSGQSVLDMHLTGAKHAKKVKSMQILNDLSATGQFTTKGNSLWCEACGIEANSSQQLQTHLSGNKHKQRVAKLATSGQIPPMPVPPPAPLQPPLAPSQIDSALMPPPPLPQLPFPGEPTVPGEESPASLRNYVCDICELYLNSAQQLTQHQESRKHKEKASGRYRHSPYGSGASRFKQNSKKKKKKKVNPTAYLTPLSASFVRGNML